MARPSKFIADRAQKIIEALRAGNTRAAAAEYGGIRYQTFLNWVQRGEAAKSGPFFEFFEAVKKAEAHAEARNVALIQKAAGTHWQAAAWWLERRRHEHWKPREEIGGDPERPLRIVVERNRRNPPEFMGASSGPAEGDGGGEAV